MTGSRNALIALAIAALIALGIAAFDRPTAPVDHALVPGLDPAAITEIEGPGYALVRAPGASRFAWREPAGAVEPDAMDRMLTALRGARWQRRASRSAAGTLAGRVVVKVGATAHVIERGQPLEGTAQDWIVVDGEAQLVERWVADALSPVPLALRIQHPFAKLKGPLVLTWHGPLEPFVLDGYQLAWRGGGGGGLRIAVAYREDLDGALAAVTVVALAPADPVSIERQPLKLEFAGGFARALGTCDNRLVMLETGDGDGCVEPDAWAAVVKAVERLHLPASATIERRIAPGARRVTLGDLTELDLLKQIEGFDPARLAALSAALRETCEIALGRSELSGKIAIDGVRLDLYADGSVARAGEPERLMPSVDATKLLRAGGDAFRDPRLWNEEPTTITSITIDGKTTTRGATIGAWSATPEVFEALAEALGAPVALEPATLALTDSAHVIVVAVHRPDGTDLRHTVALGSGCRARTEARSLRLAASICALVERAK